MRFVDSYASKIAIKELGQIETLTSFDIFRGGCLNIKGDHVFWQAGTMGGCDPYHLDSFVLNDIGFFSKEMAATKNRRYDDSEQHAVPQTTMIH